MVAMENLGDGIEVTGEVALGPLRDTTTAPGDEDVLGQTTVGVFDLQESELNATLVEIFDEVGNLTIYSCNCQSRGSSWQGQMESWVTDLQCSGP